MLDDLLGKGPCSPVVSFPSLILAPGHLQVLVTRASFIDRPAEKHQVEAGV